MKRIAIALALSVAFPLLAVPRITNGSVRTVSSLGEAEKSAGNGWISYAIATQEPVSIDCWDGDGVSMRRREAGDDLRTVGESVINVFARLDGGQVDKLRVYSPGCTLDVAGRTVLWVESVPEGESIAFLRRVAENGGRHARNGALLALAFHANAIDALIDIARNDTDAHLRGQALFWLAQRAGEKAAAALRDAVDHDPEDSVRSRAVFGISQLPDDQSIPILADLLEHSPSRAVRKQAAFWLGQKKDPKAFAVLERILKR